MFYFLCKFRTANANCAAIYKSKTKKMNNNNNRLDCLLFHLMVTHWIRPHGELRREKTTERQRKIRVHSNGVSISINISTRMECIPLTNNNNRLKTMTQLTSAEQNVRSQTDKRRWPTHFSIHSIVHSGRVELFLFAVVFFLSFVFWTRAIETAIADVNWCIIC